MTPDEILQALKNQRYWPNPDTLDEDLHNVCELNAKYISSMMEVMAAAEDLTEQITKPL